jgi:hypothetical protein
VPFGATSEMWRIWSIGEGSLYRTVCQATTLPIFLNFFLHMPHVPHFLSFFSGSSISPILFSLELRGLTLFPPPPLRADRIYLGRRSRMALVRRGNQHKFGSDDWRVQSRGALGQGSSSTLPYPTATPHPRPTHSLLSFSFHFFFISMGISNNTRTASSSRSRLLTLTEVQSVTCAASFPFG